MSIHESDRRTFPHRWVMHVWSNGDATPWHTELDHRYHALYSEHPCDGTGAAMRRECTPDELQEIQAERRRLAGES